MPAFIITGMLRWSREQDFHIETDDGVRWLLDPPWPMTGEVDSLLHHRVVVEGGRTGDMTVAVSRIWEVEGVGEAVARPIA